ncbi:MAG TPA: hypothetical protein GXX47_06800 [Firmicutes bacterium]|nr:hypothetical protein [Bacillota bacterium]
MPLAVIGILLRNRRKQAPEVQEVLTKYGDLILARSGVHDPERERGLITLTVEGSEEEITALQRELEDVSGTSAGTALLIDE